MNTDSVSAEPRKPNRLSKEKSPYLLQHQFNPVDWYAWGAEAFESAKRLDRPIFLSIGYSTCHWCHVMERESFENEAVAKFLNEHFVSIKVDREERPDVDKIYMSFVQATTGQGGWPLNVFLTPELKPFFGGTYFPPSNNHGRPGFLQLLQQIAELWANRRQDISGSAEEIHSKLQRAAATGLQPEDRFLSQEVLRHAGLAFKDSYDSVHGGFGGAPKFPQPSQPEFLLRYAKRFHDQEATQMVLHTCDAMAAGGIHDQLGGGFARYSVDAQWLVPHFEKMLYDNAQLAHLFLDAFLVSGSHHHASVVRDVLDYVLRDMTHPQGGFYSAEDADSEGHEGKYYCWTRQELSKLLTAEEFNIGTKYFGITERGNFLDHSHPHPLPGQNVLSMAHPKLRPQDEELLDSARRKMIAERAKRVRPHLDDKILVSWNGLMLGAMARAAVVLGEARYRNAAETNLAFLQTRLWEAQSRTLYHRWRDGQRDSVQLLDGYAFLLSGVLDLYEATVEPKHLEFALSLAGAMLEKFYDSQNGGFWQATAGTPDLILRMKEDYDGAEPSGNSVACLALLKLGKIAGKPEFTAAAEKTLRLFSSRLEQFPQAVPYMLQALDFSLEEPKRAVVAGEPGKDDTASLLHAVHSVFEPNKVVLGNLGHVEAFAQTLPAKDHALLYLCTGNACQAPTRDSAAITSLLRGENRVK
ncbi:MAG TPA: thioredoxin domain-containing protein [Verrucomicrobiae bacterium]|nr:thioredoxin domain-containing protein [Verrucomicrobiae bacterium]